MIVAAVLVAAGDGRRLGAKLPKAFVPVAGRALLAHCADRFVAHPLIRDVVIAAPAAFLHQAQTLCRCASVVPGGATRQHSVSKALAALADDVDVVLVHDVARSFVPAELITRVIDAIAAGADAVVPGVAVNDTIRSVDLVSGELGEIVDRSGLLAMQTPQGFRRTLLVEAHAHGDELGAATDDAALVEALGVRVRAVRGDERAFKVTVPLDLALAEILARD